MPFQRVRWRLAAWNLAILTLVLALTIVSVWASESAEIRANDPDVALEEEARLAAILTSCGIAGLILAGVGSLFLAGRAMGPINVAFDRQRQFVADASHELRTSVAVLRARSEVLHREGEAIPPASRAELRRLRQDADELSTLLDELLDLARLEAGLVTVEIESLALAEVVEEIAAQLQPLARARDVVLEVATQPVWGRGNLTRVRQVLRALADNSLEHTHAGGRVRLSVERDGRWARIMVADTGRGISTEKLPRVFDRFYHDGSARRGGGGAGLGLAISSQLVHLMHGQLSLESEVGRGTTATVDLPLARGGPQPFRRAALRQPAEGEGGSEPS